MKTSLKKIKTIDIIGLEWFDKINGNSYNSAEIIINYGLKNEETLYKPFSYGYGRCYEYDSLDMLGIKHVTLRDSKIILRSSITKALKRDVVRHGEG